MPLTSPLQDTGALFSSRAVTHHEQQSLLAFVLEQLAKREPAGPPDFVDLDLRVQARSELSDPVRWGTTFILVQAHARVPASSDMARI